MVFFSHSVVFTEARDHPQVYYGQGSSQLSARKVVGDGDASATEFDSEQETKVNSRKSQER